MSDAKSIHEISEELKDTQAKNLTDFIAVYSSDERSGVQKLVARAQKRLQQYQQELKRIEGMKSFEKKYADSAKYICGIDEVGRGPLAGPVVACAVILPRDCDILYINDSKQLSAKKREALYDQIMAEAVSVGIGSADNERIDAINILQADYEAMRQAISQLDPQPDLLLNDAVTIPGVDLPQVNIVHGDARSISIAAASIIAKVTRDRLMEDYDSVYPQYHFASNKGYGSAEHIAALKEYGPCPLHRKTFITHFVENAD